MGKKRFQRLSVYDASFGKRSMSAVAEEYGRLGKLREDWDPGTQRTGDIAVAFNAVVFAHLDFKPEIPTERILEKGVELFVDFMTGNWWVDAPGYEKGPFSRHWIDGYVRGATLCLLANETSRLAMCSERLEGKHRHGSPQIPLEICDCYLVVALSMSARKAKAKTICRRIKQGRNATAKRFLECYESIEQGDEKLFQKSLLILLKRYAKTRKASEGDCFDVHSSVLAMLAKENSLNLPELTEELADLLMCRQTVL